MSEADVKRAVTDLLSAEKIPWWPMNAGDRFGSYTQKSGKKSSWRIKGQEPGTADLLCKPPMRCVHDGCRAQLTPWLWIELKCGIEKQSQAQKAFEKRVTEMGMFYLLARSSDEVLSWLKEHK